MALLDVTSSELAKLRTLPVAILAVLSTVLVGAAIATTLVRAGAHVPATAAEAVLGVVPFAQAGIILLGILPATHEHAGGQYRTTLAAVPNRGLLITAKSISALITLAVTAALTIGVSLAAGAITQHLSSAPTATAAAQLRLLVGAAVYLTLIGMLSHAVALLVRHLVPALVTMLALVLIVPPFAGVTEHARWLPSRAGGLLYLPGTDPVLTAGTGTLVLLAWIITIGAVASTSIGTRDA